MSNGNPILNRERETTVLRGSLMLPTVLAMLFGGLVLFIYSVMSGVSDQGHPLWLYLVLGIFLFVLSLFLLPGFFSLEPNEARVLILFGNYKGTVRKSGFYWGNPFYANGTTGTHAAELAEWKTKMAAGKVEAAGPPPKGPSRRKVSLRARTLNVDRLKVNDKQGNPIEIAAVLVWRVQDTAQAVFDVDDYENYVRMQSESALRHLASSYAYDHGEEHEITLRSNMDEVSQALCKELQERLAKAGIVAEEARLTHLAYAPEIAQAMLRRQQAEAVIAARQKIVHGAVSMVEMALKELAEKQVVQLDDERKAAMVSNLMVVLCGESEVHPVVNTGTLYN
jgi:regulator of protease activity HflC (stomatin/prohibitin superfamily)